jgi:transporter family protein
MNWLIWSLFSALFAGLTAILAKVGVTGVDSNLATAVRTSVVLIFTWLFLTLSGLATGLSWLCYFRALQLGEASRVAPVDKLSVVFVIVFAAAFLREPMAARTVLGGTLIAAGAVVLALK